MVWNSARGTATFGHQENHRAAVADDPGADLDQSLTQRGQCRHALAVGGDPGITVFHA
jgi:hypothetical protein